MEESKLLKQYDRIIQLKKRARFYADMTIHFNKKYRYSQKTTRDILKKCVLHPFMNVFKYIFDYKKVYHKFEKECKKYNGQACIMVADFCLPVGLERMQRPKVDFDNLILVDFEFINIPVYKNYDYDLKISFGEDYLVFKPGGGDHGELIFDTNKSYKLYM